MIPPHPSPPPSGLLLLLRPSSYLQVRGSLEGLVADAADVAAVFPVGLSAVAPQRVGVLEHLVAVVALVLVLSPRLTVLPSLVVRSDLEHANRSVNKEFFTVCFFPCIFFS